MSPQFLAVDIGTSSTKGIVIDAKANILAQEFIYHTDLTNSLGLHEHDAENQWWGEFISVVKRMLNQLGSQTAIDGICISGMWPNFCPTDADGLPLCNALLYNDRRSLDISRSIKTSLGPITRGYEYLPRLLWLRENTPYLWARTKRIFSTHNYVTYRLTGEYSIDSHTACVLGNLFDPERFGWKQDIFREFDIPLHIMPRVYPPSAIIGYVTENASRLTGLKSGIPVVVGAGDTFISILSSGAHLAGDGIIYYGSLGMFIRLTKDIDYIIDAASYKNGDEGLQWLLGLPDSGKQLEGLARILQGTQAQSASEINWDGFDILARNVTSDSSDLVFIHNILRPREITLALTPHASIIGLTVNSSAADIYRAALDGFGFALCRALENSNVTINDFNRIFAAGGGAKSELWRKITSDIIQFPQYYLTSSGGAIGGAILAGHATGAFKIHEQAENRIGDANLQKPDERFQSFDRKYSIYKSLSESINDA